MAYDPPFVILPVIHVRINGSANTLAFVVDTGVDAPVILADWAAHDLGLSPVANAEPVPMNGIPFHPYGLKSFALVPSAAVATGNNNVGEITITGLDSIPAGDISIFQAASIRERIAGVIGIPILLQVPGAAFDFSGKSLILYVNKPPDPPAGSIVLPLQPEQPSYPTRRQKVMLPAPYSAATPVLDTGATDTSLPYAAVYPALTESVLAQRPSGDFGIDRVSLSTEVLLDRLPLGETQTSESTRRIAVGVVAAGDTSVFVNGVLGDNLLERFRVILDGTNHRLILAPASSPPAWIHGDGDTGIRLAAAEPGKDGYAVSRIIPGSPAAQAGVRVGDRIVAVDGIRFRDGGPAGGAVSYLSASRILTGWAGAAAVIELLPTASHKKATETHTLKIDRLDRFDPVVSPPSPWQGLQAIRKNGGPIQVTGVAPDSPAAQAGLHVGDCITAIDGKPVAPIGIEEFPSLIYGTSKDDRHKTVTLTVTHSPVAGGSPEKPRTVLLHVPSPAKSKAR